jgi:hypothetical protein
MIECKKSQNRAEQLLGDQRCSSLFFTQFDIFVYTGVLCITNVFHAGKKMLNRAQTTHAHQEDGPHNRDVRNFGMSPFDVLLSTFNVERRSRLHAVIGPKRSFLAKFISSPSGLVTS